MKEFLKKAMAVALAATFILGSAPLAGFCGLDLLSLSANAAEETEFSYIVNVDEITITGHSNPMGNLVIPAEINGMPVTKIADSAFTDCKNILSVSIPATVSSIERIAFSGCTSLMTVTFEKRDESQTLSTGGYIFKDCTALSSINLEDANITEMGGGFFFNCTSLEKMAIPETVTEIGGAVFHGCTKLSEVTLNKNMTSLGNFGGGVSEGFFQNCKNLKGIVIPANITTIGDKTFLGSGLQNITFENGTGLTTIGDQAFSESDLTSIVIPATVTSIGPHAFSGCNENLETVTFEKRDENQYLSMESDVFANCTKLSSINLEDSNVISMGDRSFLNCSSLTKIVMPDTLVTVGAGFFSDCTKLSDVTLSKNMTSLSKLNEHYFFKNCKALKEIVIPASITYIGERTFEGSGLEKITFAEGSKLVTIYYRAFYGTNLQNITIPASVEVIGESAFDSTPLEYVVFEGTGPLEIHQAAFIRNDNLTDVYYAGTEEEWNEQVTWYSHNDCLLNATMHFNSNGPKEPQTLTNDEFDVKASFNEGCYDTDVELSIKPVEKDREPGGIYIPDDMTLDRVGCFDISIVEKGTNKLAEKKADEKVTIRMPIPDNFKKVTDFRIVHYFKNGGYENLSTTATNENLKITVDGDYLVFSVTKFSDFDVFAVVPKDDTPDTPDTPDVPVLPTILIKNNTGSKTINYGETLRLTANTSNMPADAKIFWYVDGVKMGEGTTFEYTSKGGTAEISVKIVDVNGNDYAETEISDTEKVTVKSGFFQKLISFFKNLFRISRIVTQSFIVK